MEDHRLLVAESSHWAAKLMRGRYSPKAAPEETIPGSTMLHDTQLMNCAGTHEI